MKKIILLLVLTFTAAAIHAQIRLPGLFPSPYFSEQSVTFNYEPEIRVHINGPSTSQFNASKPAALVLYALPNGNTIEQTVGKILEPGDDWHFDIQHIGAQTRFLRQQISEYNIITIYLETAQKSWPAWKAAHSDHAQIIKKLSEYLMAVYSEFDPFIVLTGHSGGGRFTFSFMDAFTEIPSYVKRISFLDSNYGYEHSYGNKIINWLNASPDNYLSVIAYNDSVALYNGQPVVSPTGGTWYRSRIMKNYMSSYFTFTNEEDSSFIKHTALSGRIKFILKKNPLRQILHTVQVEKNGHIQGMLSGTGHEGAGYTYYGSRAYSQWIQINTLHPAQLTIPPRNPGAKTGSEFMQFVTNMSFAQRETEIYNELAAGNIPEFLRTLTLIEASFQDVNGTPHTVKYQTMPDYLAIGSDSNYCRIPMGPLTAQRIADLFGAVMPTRKLVDNIYTNSVVKLQPVTYAPVGNQNELVPKFIQHNSAIDSQFALAGGVHGQLTGGTKKDVVLSNKIIDPARPNHVCIYGWHQLNGQPIQPLTNIHINTYVDYSHGIRFLNNEILLDGTVKNITDVLKDNTLYKVLSDESGAMLQPSYISTSTPPAQPKSWGVKSEGSNSLKVIIKPDPSFQSYKIYGSTDGLNFNAPLSSTSSQIVVSGLQSGSIYYVKIKGVNSNGDSPESELLACKTGAGNNILIVNGFDRASTGNTYNFVIEHAAALSSNGAGFNSCSNEAVTDGLFNLTDYTMADYILGDESTADETFSAAEQEKLKLFLRAGGRLFVSGCELAWDLDYKGSAADKEFIHDYLKIYYIADAPNNQSSYHYQCSVPPGSIFGSLTSFFFDNGTHGGINVKYPDVIKSTGGYTAALYTGFDTSYGYAGAYYTGPVPGSQSPASVVAFGIPFESIYPSEVRDSIMKCVLNYFSILTAVESDHSTLPSSFKLYNNYPNPFNPSTTIRYDLPVESRVELIVYNILGEKAVTLVNQHQEAGSYDVVFNAGTLSSGTYIYELRTEGLVLRNKMLFLK